MKKSRLLGVVFICICASHANAAPIQFDFEGYITYSELVEGPNQGQAIPGMPVANTLITGSYIFESTVSDSNAGDSYGHYENILSLVVNVGALTYSYNNLNPLARGYIEVDNNTGTLYIRDKYSVTIAAASVSDVINGPNIGDYKLYSFSLSLFDWGDVIAPELTQDDSLPLVAPDLELLTDAYNFGGDITTEIVFSYIDTTSGIRGKLRGEVTSLTTVVPIPASVLLFGSGLLGLVGLARKKTA